MSARDLGGPISETFPAQVPGFVRNAAVLFKHSRGIKNGIPSTNSPPRTTISLLVVDEDSQLKGATGGVTARSPLVLSYMLVTDLQWRNI